MCNHRLESIAADAELQEKTIQALVSLASYLMDKCNAVMREQEEGKNKREREGEREREERER